ncbi:hypothetical protein Prum_053850 [Phytohabitans rumicis]|uniref:Uncharacterized protein n=1 Tax=Phytohabitans rumicis TaxID=1076125 RepID=A0A6V8L3A0_9ACTN|nr:hypothetical protein Prum_053850 [Phytohabitans rumicis]
MQGLRAVDPGARLVEHPALAEQHERAVGERRQVAGRAERAVLGHPRGHVVVEQVDEALRDQGADAGAAQRERTHPQQHHRPYHLARHGGADARGVRADERVL